MPKKGTSSPLSEVAEFSSMVNDRDQDFPPMLESLKHIECRSIKSQYVYFLSKIIYVRLFLD